MKALISLTILVGSAAASAAALTGNELVLLRMILRQEMAADVQAAGGLTGMAAGSRAAPLQTALLEIPRVHELHAIVADHMQDTITRFNAARALAYFGDTRSIEFLSGVLGGQSRYFANGTEQGRAALCLLYLGCDLPDGFAFSKLTPALYPELDALLDKPDGRLEPSSPYSKVQLETAIALYLASGYPVTVRGPLCVLTAEQEALATVLCDVAEHDRTDVVRVAFGNQAYEWEEFKDQIREGDLLYHFRSDDDAWQAQEGSEGYALIRRGEVVALILTATNRGQDADLLLFEDFTGPLGLGWRILNSDPSYWSLARVPGCLTITTQTGTFDRNRQDYRNVFLINCPAAAGQDFQMTTCLVSFRPIGLWNQAGLLLWNSHDDYLKLDYEYGAGPEMPQYARGIHTAGLEIGGVASFTWYYAEQYPEKVWLRIVKRGAFCELFASTDGESFTPLTALVPEFGPADHRVYWGDAEVAYVGLYAGSGTTTNPPSVEASFDFFELKALPALDE